MSSVIQVTFDPSKWTDGNGAGTAPGDNGYDAASVFFDNDGTTAWAFEYYPSGFARFNLSDGSIIVQDALFGDGTGFAALDTKSEGHNIILWAQDAAHYYTLYNNHLYKFHIASGPALNLLNGYCVVDAILDLGTTTPAVLSPEDMITFTSGGVNYVALASPAPNVYRGAGWVINTDTMTFVGSYSDVNYGYWKAFSDSNNDLWFAGNISPGGVNLIKWHPVDGVTGTDLNVTIQFVSDATIGFTGADSFTYIPVIHSLFIGAETVLLNTGPTAIINLTSFTQTTFHADDGMFFYEGGVKSPSEAAMDYGVQSSGLLSIPGSLNPDTVQFGGIINIIDPTTLTLQTSSGTALVTFGSVAGADSGSPVYIIQDLLGASSYDITALVNSLASTPVQIVGGHSVPFAGFAYREGALSPPTPPPPGPLPGPCAKFNLQKLILTAREAVVPVRGRNR